MLNEDLRQRLEAAGLPTDLEGMLEAVAAVHPNRAFDLVGNAPGWLFGVDGDDRPGPDDNAKTAREAVARWLLAAKEAQR